MNKADFSRLRKIGGWVQFKDGDEICNTEEARQYFYILVDGIVEGCYEYEDALLHSNGNKAKRFYSGDCFDYRVLNILGAFVEIVNLFQTTGNMQALLRTYALGILARALQVGSNDFPRSFDSYGKAETAGWAQNGERSRDFELLQPDEVAAFTATRTSFAQWFANSFAPLVPPGCRKLVFNSGWLSGNVAQCTVIAQSAVGLANLRGKGSAGFSIFHSKIEEYLERVDTTAASGRRGGGGGGTSYMVANV
eukprot:gene23447-16284_t